MTCVALLRGINVGGNNKIPMSDLRSFMESLGFDNVKTLLQSGNVVFESSRRKGVELERFLESETRKHFHLEIDYVVRTSDEWKKIIDSNPFRKEAKSDPGHLLVLFLKGAPELGAVKALQSAIVGREVIRAVGTQLFAVYPDGIGKSKLTNALMDRKLGVRGTGRNWNTVLKIAELL